MAPTTRRRAHTATVLVLAVVLAAINLRPGATSVGPVLEEVRAALGMGTATAGVLTALPPLCFGLGGAVAVALSRRLGVTGGIAFGLVVAAAALLLRVAFDIEWTFLALSVLALLTMALGNVLVPAWIKHDGGNLEVTLMTLFSMGLVTGGALGPLATPPISAHLGGWRIGLGVWGVLVVVALPIWIWLALHELGGPPSAAPPWKRPRGASPPPARRSR